MQKIKFNDNNTATKIAILLFCVFISAGCSFQLPKTITGEVVDESGQALQDVAVSICYLGWGRDDYLVWDKNYCSDPVFSDSHGRYLINFTGFLLPWSPASNSLTLRAQKEGWTRSESAYLANTRIIMANNDSIRARRSAELRLRKSHFQQRLTDESDGDYYCRVVLPHTRPITMTYEKETLSVTPALLQSREGNQAIFAVRGSAKTLTTFSDEVLLKVNRQNFRGNFNLMAARSCPADIALMSVRLSNRQLPADSELELLVPSIRAMFSMEMLVL